MLGVASTTRNDIGLALGVAYLNARPLWEALKDDPRLELGLARPSELARALAEKEAEVGLLPVAAAATMGDLRILRNMAIGARGKVRSVAIVAERCHVVGGRPDHQPQ